MLKNGGVFQKLKAFGCLVELNTVNRWLAAGAMGFFYFIATFKADFSFVQVLTGLLAIFLILCYVMAINDCFDVEEDKIKSQLTHKKLVISEEISIRDAMLLSLIMLCFGLVISWFISEAFFVVVLIIVSLSTLYSVPPVKYKRIFPLSTVGESVGAFLPFFAGYAIFGLPDVRTLIISAIFAFTTIYLRFYHEAFFREVDSKTGKMTFAIVFGSKISHNLGRGFLLFGIFESLVLLFLGWVSLEFFILFYIYLIFSLGLLIKFFELHLPTWICDSVPSWIADNIPRPVKEIFADQLVPAWGCMILIVVILFLIA